MANPVGRPLKFKTVKILQVAIDKYFKETLKEEWTVTGLAIALDTFRSVLIDYGSGKYDVEDREYSYTVKKAKHLVEHSYEIDLKKYGRSGTIFALKNFEWRDQTEVDVTSKGKVITGFNFVKNGDTTDNPPAPETGESLGEAA